MITIRKEITLDLSMIIDTEDSIDAWCHSERYLSMALSEFHSVIKNSHLIKECTLLEDWVDA